MNEKEKKVIENLKLFLDGDENEDNYMTDENLRTILNLVEKQAKVITEIKDELQRHIIFCENEIDTNINNNICYISLHFQKSLLRILKGEEDE